jgi:hypothetical protein
MPDSKRIYILHPHGESFGPYDLNFVRQVLAKGGIATTTGVTVVVDGAEVRYTDLATVLREEEAGMAT